jgi:hypothetical protein
VKTTKQQLTQIILEEIAVLFKEGAWAKYSKSEPKLPQIKDPEEEGREAKMKFADRWSKFHKAKEEPSELDRILGSDSDPELDPKTLAWIDNLIKKPDGLEQLQTFMKSLK